MKLAFAGSSEAAGRNAIRGMIKKSNLTRAEREVTIAIVNLWFNHRYGEKGYIHPSASSLAKKTRFCSKTVMRCMWFLRDCGVLIVVPNDTKGKRVAIRYKVDMIALHEVCESEFPKLLMGQKTAKCPIKSHPFRWDTMSHCNSNVVIFPSNGKANGFGECE